jgi:hypothetical protein
MINELPNKIFVCFSINESLLRHRLIRVNYAQTAEIGLEMSFRGTSTSGSQTMAGCPSTLSGSLHTHLRFMAQPSRNLVQHHHPGGVKDLIAKIERFVAEHNGNSHPFAWTATSDSILEKVKRLCQRISGMGH